MKKLGRKAGRGGKVARKPRRARQAETPVLLRKAERRSAAGAEACPTLDRLEADATNEYKAELYGPRDAKLGPLEWARKFLPHFFSEPSCEFHEELMRDLADPKRPLIARAAPRGHAKSTCASLAFPLWCICEQQRRNILIITYAYDLAMSFLRDIRLELEGNEALKAAYGDLTCAARSKTHRRGMVWGQTSLKTRSGIVIQAKGSGQSLRGARVGPFRPDLIICDDIEKDQVVRFTKHRRRLESWLRKVVIPALAPGGKLFVLGSILHFDSLLANLASREKFPRWDYRVYRALEFVPAPNGEGLVRKALWPGRWPIEKLDEERERIGTLAFEQEYMANPIDEEQPMFKPEWLQRYDASELVDERLSTYVCVDPAVGRNKGDYFALWVGSVDATTGVIYTRELFLARIKISAQVERILEACEKWKPLKVGIETTAYQATLKHLVDAESAKRGLYLSVCELKPQGEKGARVAAATAVFENGYFRLPAALDPEAEKQFLQFPNGEHDDAPDVCALAWQMVRDLKPKGKVEGLARRRGDRRW